MIHDCSLHSVLHRPLQRLMGMNYKKKRRSEANKNARLFLGFSRNTKTRGRENTTQLLSLTSLKTRRGILYRNLVLTDRGMGKRRAAPLGLLGSLLSD